MVGAEEVGFDFAVSSDHFVPWPDEMGHSPNAWVTLGAAAQATSRIDLMTQVTCPIIRYRNADLPGTAGFAAASQFVREEDVDAVIEAARAYADAGFTHLALVRIGGDHQEPCLEWTEKSLMPAWREAFGN